MDLVGNNISLLLPTFVISGSIDITIIFYDFLYVFHIDGGT